MPISCLTSRSLCLLAVMIGLAACGGETALDGNDQDANTNTTADFSVVTGVYDATRDPDESVAGDEDENYLYIDNDGRAFAYNFRDENAENCYARSMEGEINDNFDGRQLQFDGSTNEYFLILNGNRTGYVASAGTIAQVRHGNIVSNNFIDFQSADLNFLIRTNKSNSIMISDIEAALCN